jgi:hypothetical protein
MRARIMAAIAAAAWLGGAAAEAQQRGEPDLFRAGPETYAPRYDPSQPQPAPPFFPLLPYAIVLDPSAPPRARQAPGAGAQQDSGGYLSLFVRPVTAQVYVDGFFVGTIDDYAGSPGPLLDAGTHRVEIRAEGYETASFDVRIVPGEVLTLREDLVRGGLSPAPPAPAAVAPSTPGSVATPAVPLAPTRAFYVIPRCYAGDTPPKAVHLPAGCRLSDLRVVTPDR